MLFQRLCFLAVGGGGGVLKHVKGERGFAAAPAMGREERNSLVLENCARGGEDLNIL